MTGEDQPPPLDRDEVDRLRHAHVRTAADLLKAGELRQLSLDSGVSETRLDELLAIEVEKQSLAVLAPPRRHLGGFGRVLALVFVLAVAMTLAWFLGVAVRKTSSADTAAIDLRGRMVVTTRLAVAPLASPRTPFAATLLVSPKDPKNGGGVSLPNVLVLGLTTEAGTTSAEIAVDAVGVSTLTGALASSELYLLVPPHSDRRERN